MLKKSFLITVLLISMTVSGQNPLPNLSQNNIVISNFIQLSPKQLLDTADYYFNKNSIDTAFICYSLIINTPAKDNNIEIQKIRVEAYNKCATLHYNVCDYRGAYDLLIKSLTICEKINYESYIPLIYNQIGSIYFNFKKNDIAKSYFSKALQMNKDTVCYLYKNILGNLGATELYSENIDSAFYYLSKALQISNQNENISIVHSTLNNLGILFQRTKQYDSAFYYYHLALENAKNNNKANGEVLALLNLGSLFFDMNKPDSAQFYIELSNAIAVEHNFLTLLAENYRTLSTFEESKGNIRKAFEYHKKYVSLKDSTMNTDILSDINQLQRYYEVTKTNRQIEHLIIEQQIKERTIYYQTIIMFIFLLLLIIVSIGLLYIYFQKRYLNKAYKTLFEKNLEIIEYQKQSSETFQEKYQKSALTDDIQHELLDKILALMEDISIICDADFSIDKLAELVQSNKNYVSQVINSTLKKNFRSLLNSYRICEAQRIIAEPDAAKYTIEYISLRVGFKSPNTFRNAFKDITGINPNFYVKSMQKRHSHCLSEEQ